MAGTNKFCKYCGQPLEEGKIHICPNRPASEENQQTDPYQSTQGSGTWDSYQGSQSSSYQSVTGGGVWDSYQSSGKASGSTYQSTSGSGSQDSYQSSGKASGSTYQSTSGSGSQDSYQNSGTASDGLYQNVSGNSRKGTASGWNQKTAGMQGSGSTAQDSDSSLKTRDRMRDVGNTAADVAGRTAQWAKKGAGWAAAKAQKAAAQAEQERTSSGGAYERNRPIVDQCIVPTEEEIPVRQYDIAVLRTIFPYKRAEGRLQVTNKRVIFRATGKSWLGPHFLENEFSLSEIGGIELKQDHRVNFWFIFPALALLFFSTLISGGIAGLIYKLPSFFLILYSFAAVAGCVALSYFLKKYFWVKMCAWMVPTMGFYMMVSKSQYAYYRNYGYSGSSNAGTFWMVLYMLCFIAVAVFTILYMIKEDLIIKIKVTGANNVMEIRRQQTTFFFFVKEEYTGFAEVLPGKDAEMAARELGALINDVKLYGDAGIRKWQV